jgi:putative two-component system response regulator
MVGNFMKAQKVIAIIDDEQINHTILKGLLSDIYIVDSFLSSEDFLKKLHSKTPDLILLDIIMPESDGYETILKIHAMYPDKSIPIIFLTSKSDSNDEAKGFQLGAVDYITKPFNPTILIERIKSHLKLIDVQKKLKHQNEFLNKQVEERILEYNLIQDISLSVIAQIVEKRDLDTGNHINRTKLYFQTIAEELKKNSIYKEELKNININQLAKASILHDIGKVAIPDHILKKPGKLTKDEWEVMKKHCLYGDQVIHNALNLIYDGEEIETLELNTLITFFKDAKEIALNHHEKWNGTGYPSQLSKTQIPLSARIMSVADVFDALLTNRVYKKAWDIDKVLNLIKTEKGKHFDPVIVDALFIKLDTMIEISKRYAD